MGIKRDHRRPCGHEWVQDHGFSLAELLVVLVIIGMLIATATPGFSRIKSGAELTASVNQMVGAIHFARSTAILQGLPSIICLSANGERCTESTGGLARGWLVFVDNQGSTPPQLDAADTLLRRVDLAEGVTVRATRPALTFWPTSRSGTSGTFTFCHAHAANAARAVVVSQTGRPRIAVREPIGCAP